ncbi:MULTISPECIES: SusC/RagA family TonB-linked outer membrane protein [Prevotella]|nr:MULTISPECIES: TonB-dependent receptor [Prevotella]MDN5554597.1 TonB-dependent receptor [Prevotella sp.]
MRNLSKILMSLILMMVCVAASAQKINVSGTIFDSAGETVIGATVIEKGTTNGSVTDMDGHFKLSVGKNATLVVSYIGYKTKEVAALDGMKVTLQEASNDLNEVVVTGYTTQRKADLTGAVSVVNVKDLAKQNENNPIKAMQGRVPGMDISADGSPSGAATVRIRGNGTLNNNDPLYIIDGVPTKSGMHELNGNDIESIQVLKDAASASIYGSRAANGVIIITTKKGKDGKAKVNLDASIAASMYANRMKVLNAKQWGQAFWQANVNDGLDPNNNSVGYHFNWGYDEHGNPQLNGMTMQKYLDAAGTIPASDTNWMDETTRTGLIQNYNVSISNGNDKGSSYFSLGYYKNLGVIKDTDFNRISGRVNTEYKLLGNFLTIGENLTINRTSEVAEPNGFLGNVLQYNPTFPVYNTKGEYANLTGSFADRENPVEVLNRNKDNRYTYWRMFGDVHLNFNITKNFVVRTTAGIDYAQKEQRFFTYPITNGNVSNKDNAVEAKQEHWMSWMWNAVATYNLEIGKHRADALLGIELNRQDDMWFGGKRYGFAVNTPDYMWPDAGVGDQQAFGSSDGFSLASFFGKINYNYADKYMASVTVRRDGSSRFGKNNRYGTFPSLSLGWRISQEKFMQQASNSWLSDLKLRASWGQTGNQDINNYARYTLYVSNYGEANFGGQSYGTSYDIAGTNGGQPLGSGFKRNQLGNDNIKWETTTQTNLGFDFGFFKNSLYGSFEWYRKKTSDILVNMPGIGIMGEGSSMWINAGEMLNKGVEFNAGYRGNVGAFNYDFTGNIGTNRNEVTKLPETIAAAGTFGGSGVFSVVGHPMNSYVGYVYDGIFKNQAEVDNHAKQEGAAVGRMRFKDLNNDGVITTDDQKWIYDPTPAFTYGLNFYLRYKNLDFTMFWQGVQNVDVLTTVRPGDDTNGGYKVQTDLWAGVNVPFLNKGDRVLDAWTPTNSSSTIPALSTYDNNNEKRFSSYYVEDGSFIKLRTIEIGYSLPDALVKKISMSKIRMYFSAQNLLTIKSHKFTGVDPENALFGYPIPLNLTFGLNVSF